MKSFALREGLGHTTVREIGQVLRTYGSGTHWIEYYRGQIFINVSEPEDETILRRDFSNAVEPAERDL